MTQVDTSTDFARCAHELRALRVKTLSNGALQYRRQCLTCGNGGQAIPKALAFQEMPAADIPPYDECAEDAWYAGQFAQGREDAARRAGERVAARLTEMANYYETREWRDKRDEVLRRDLWRCQAQLDGCTHRAVQVHHLTYAHFRCEPLFDLTSVCISCHEQITSLDRESRRNGNV